MRLTLVFVLFGSLGLPAGRAWAAAATCDPATLATARAAITGCNCATATSHKDYVKCVGDAVKTVVKAKTLSKECGRAVHKCAAKSTCGASGAVACCETNAKGTTKCSIKRDSTACKAPHGGSFCLSTTHSSCCDACGTSGCAP